MNATTSPAVPLFFFAGGGAFAGLVTELPLLPFVALALLASIAAIATRERLARALSLPLVALALSAAAGAWQRDLGAMRTTSLPRDLAVYEGVVDDVLFSATGHTRFVLDVDGALANDKSPIALDATLGVVVPPGVAVDVRPGDRIRVRGVARAFAPASSPGELDALKLALARGLDARLSVSRPFDVALMKRAEELRPFANTRIALRARLSSLLPPRLAGLELALLVGDTSFLDEEQREIYRRVGAGHLLAVSGLQVSLIALLLERFALLVLMTTSLGRRGRGRALATGAALAGVWAFVLLCGAPPSAVRAGAMASAVLFAALVGRRARAFDAIGIAGLITVLLSPASVLDPSFLLSYGAVLGLAATTVRSDDADDLASDTAPRPHVKMLRAILNVVVASIGAGVVTMPLSAWLFGEIAPAGLLANIVLVPLATLVQVPALALGLLGALLNASWIAWLGAQAALFLEAVAAGLGDLLPAVRTVPATGGLTAALLVVVALLFAAALARRRRTHMIVSSAAALVVLFAASWEPSGIRIAVLPVGQGDGAVVELPDGTVIVIDAGGTHDGRLDPGRDVVTPFLKRRGIDKVDIMIASHPHPDHVGGLPSVARAFGVRALWHNGAHVGPLMQRVLDALPEGAEVKTTPELIGVHRFGDGDEATTIEVLAPAPAERTAIYPELDANDNSLVLRICLRETCALWPGDVEALGEGLLLETQKELKADVVKAPHHGSRSSSTDPFVAATGAKHVIFCTGRDNTFGFPHEEVVTRWQAASARLWDTARHGEITVFLTGEAVDVHGFTN